MFRTTLVLSSTRTADPDSRSHSEPAAVPPPSASGLTRTGKRRQLIPLRGERPREVPAQPMSSKPEPRSEDSFEEILRSLRPSLKGILARRHIPYEDAEDLVQNAFLAYLRKADTVRNPHTWIKGALDKECLMYWRSRGRRLYDSVDQALLELVTDHQGTQQERHVLLNRLDSVIADLHPRCQSILRLRYRLGCDRAEIAAQTGYREGSVDKIARRCLTALSQRLLRSRRLDKEPRHGRERL